MQEVFFSEAKKGYNKQEVEAFLKRVNDENLAALQAKADEYKRLLNKSEAMKAEYESRISELEDALSEKTAKCEESAAKYDELCAKMGEKLLFAESEAARIKRDAEEEKARIEAEAELKAEQTLAAISAKAREDAAAVLRAADILKQKSALINSGLEQTKRLLEDAISQIEKAVKNDKA